MWIDNAKATFLSVMYVLKNKQVQDPHTYPRQDWPQDWQ